MKLLETKDRTEDLKILIIEIIREAIDITAWDCLKEEQKHDNFMDKNKEDLLKRILSYEYNFTGISITQADKCREVAWSLFEEEIKRIIKES